jgi:hypothetical protein
MAPLFIQIGVEPYSTYRNNVNGGRVLKVVI